MLGAASSYLGSTGIQAGTLKAGTDNVLPAGTAVTLGSGTTAANVDFDTFDQTNGLGSLTVASNSATANTVTIGAGKTLVINGPVTVGQTPTTTAGTTTNVTFTGGGALAVNSTTGIFQVAVSDPVTNGTGNGANMDLSGLAEFNATVSQLRIGSVNVSKTSSLVLAPKSTITAGVIHVSPYAAGATGSLKLGSDTNQLNADTINIGVIAANNGQGSVTFLGSTGTLTIRGKNGGTTAAAMTLGSSTTNGGSADHINVFDTRGHSADVKLSTLSMATFASGSAATARRKATFSFDQGGLSINTVTMATKGGAGATAAGKPVTATMNLGGGTVSIGTGSGTAVTLATQTGGGAAAATLNITGTANATVKGNIIDGGGTTTSTLSLDGSALDMSGNNMGRATNPIDVLTLASGTLRKRQPDQRRRRHRQNHRRHADPRRRQHLQRRHQHRRRHAQDRRRRHASTPRAASPSTAPMPQFMHTSTCANDRTFTLTQGTLGGTGTITTAITSGANVTIAPGDRTLATPAKGTLTIAERRESHRRHDRLPALQRRGRRQRQGRAERAGSLTFGGTLKVAKSGSWTFADGQSWDLFDLASRGGSSVFSNDAAVFNVVDYGGGDLPALTGGLKYQFDYDTGVLSIAGSGGGRWPDSGTWVGRPTTSGPRTTRTNNNWSGGYPSAAGHTATFTRRRPDHRRTADEPDRRQAGPDRRRLHVGLAGTAIDTLTMDNGAGNAEIKASRPGRTRSTPRSSGRPPAKTLDVKSPRRAAPDLDRWNRQPGRRRLALSQAAAAT